MKGRQKRPGRARITTPLEALDEKDTIMHYNAVLIEDLRSGLKQVIEAVESLRVEFRTEMNDFRREVNERFSTLELAVRRNSQEIAELRQEVAKLWQAVAEIRQDIAELRQEMAGLRQEMHTMEGRLSERIDRHGPRLDDHERRIIALELLPKRSA